MKTRMATTTVRVLTEDMARLGELSGMPEGVPFGAKLHALLRRLEGGADLDAMRRVLREELERLAGGA